MFDHQAVKERAHTTSDPFRLVMQRIEHKEHFHKAHHTHALRASGCVKLLAKVKSAAIGMANVGPKEVSIFVKLCAEVIQEVRLGCLEVVRLDSVHCLWVVSE